MASSSWGRVGGVVAVGLALSGVAHAQTPATSFDELSKVLQVGQRIVVTDETGRKTKGEVAEVMAESLVILERDQIGTQRPVRFAPASVTQIRRTDSLWNGILIGAGLGIGVTTGIVRYRCGGSDPECTANAAGKLGFALVPAFAGAGALIDRLIGHSLVYRGSTPGRAAVAVSPRLGVGEAGVSVSVGF